jgi:hypothetical protein
VPVPSTVIRPETLVPLTGPGPAGALMPTLLLLVPLVTSNRHGSHQCPSAV